METIIKKERIAELLMEIDPPMEMQFYDYESNKLLDEKIAVFEALKDGKRIGEIEGFFDIFELLPEEGVYL